MLSITAVNPRAKVLVVEDEEPLALLLRYNLEAEGYHVAAAARKLYRAAADPQSPTIVGPG